MWCWSCSLASTQLDAVLSETQEDPKPITHTAKTGCPKSDPDGISTGMWHLSLIQPAIPCWASPVDLIGFSLNYNICICGKQVEMVVRQKKPALLGKRQKCFYLFVCICMFYCVWRMGNWDMGLSFFLDVYTVIFMPAFSLFQSIKHWLFPLEIYYWLLTLVESGERFWYTKPSCFGN